MSPVLVIATGTVTGQVVNSLGQPVAGLPVAAKLNAGISTPQSIAPAGQIVPGEVAGFTDSTGAWSLALVPNNNINPSNTTYTIQIPGMPDVAISLTDTASHPYLSIAVSPTTATLLPAGQTVAALTVTGLLTAQAGENVTGALATAGPDPWYDVKHPTYGAKGDGVTDDSAAIQAAINACNAAGGGAVYFPPGTYVCAGISFFGKARYVGAANEGTVLLLKAASNTFLWQTNNFGSLAAGGGGSGPGTSTGGETLFSLENLTFDGNKANNGTSTVPVVRIYGFGFSLFNVHVRNGNNDNLYSEWSTSLPSPGLDSMMAQLVNLKVHDAGRAGVHWNGPHDTQWCNGEVYNNNSSAQVGAAGAGIWADAKGNGLIMFGVHSWGLTQSWPCYMAATGCGASGCVFEGAITAQLGMDANDCWVNGGFIYGAGAAAPKGIVLGVTAQRQDLTVWGVKINNCTSGAIDFTNDAGALVIAEVFQSGGTLFVGTINTLTRLTVRTNGVAGTVERLPNNVEIHGGNALKFFNNTDSAFATISFDGSQVNNTWPYQGAAGQFVAAGAGIRPGTAAGAVQAGNLFMGSGVPSNTNGNNGDFYFRTDTPGTANQRLYIKSAGAWVALTL